MENNRKPAKDRKARAKETAPATTATSQPKGDKQYCGATECKRALKNPEFWLLFGTLIAAGTAAYYTMQQSKIAPQAMVGDQRAWIAPDHIAIDKSQGDPIGQGNDLINLIVYYRNVGKSPALDMAERLLLNTTDVASFTPLKSTSTPGAADEGPFPQLGPNNPACNGLSPMPGGKAAYPSDRDLQQTLWFKKFSSTVPLMEAKFILIAYGCFSYRSFGERQTAFCFYFDPVKDQAFRNWNVKLCPNGGNYAN